MKLMLALILLICTGSVQMTVTNSLYKLYSRNIASESIHEQFLTLTKQHTENSNFQPQKLIIDEIKPILQRHRFETSFSDPNSLFSPGSPLSTSPMSSNADVSSTFPSFFVIDATKHSTHTVIVNEKNSKIASIITKYNLIFDSTETSFRLDLTYKSSIGASIPLIPNIFHRDIPLYLSSFEISNEKGKTITRSLELDTICKHSAHQLSDASRALERKLQGLNSIGDYYEDIVTAMNSVLEKEPSYVPHKQDHAITIFLETPHRRQELENSQKLMDLSSFSNLDYCFADHMPEFFDRNSENKAQRFYRHRESHVENNQPIGLESRSDLIRKGLLAHEHRGRDNSPVNLAFYHLKP